MPGEVIDHYPSLGHWSHRVDPTQGFLRPLGFYDITHPRFFLPFEVTSLTIGRPLIIDYSDFNMLNS